MARSVSEWIGKTDDHRAPGKVRQRVFDRERSCCHLCSQPIQAGEAWDLDHVKALCNGGEHRENNLAPALRDAHRKKTAADVAERAKTDRIRKKHLGIKTRKSRPLFGTEASGWRKPFNAPPERRS